MCVVGGVWKDFWMLKKPLESGELDIPATEEAVLFCSQPVWSATHLAWPSCDVYVLRKCVQFLR